MTLKLNKSFSEQQPDKKMQQMREKKKPILLKQLENELKHLDDMDNQDFTNEPEPQMKDVTLKRLQMIYKEANKLEIHEIEKLSRLAIGKRILNIQLKRRKDQHNAKLRKKQKIQLFFRQNRIKRFDYNALMEQSLNHSTFIVKANDNGKGFVQSDKFYRDNYSKALAQCNYLRTVKEVNRIFYSNYSGNNKNATPISETLLKLVWIPLMLFILMGVTLPFVSFLYEQVILLVLLGVILIILFFVVVQTFKNKPNQFNQIEQSTADVRAYFQSIKVDSDLKGTNVEWKVSSDFMYLEVVFHSGFPS